MPARWPTMRATSWCDVLAAASTTSDRSAWLCTSTHSPSAPGIQISKSPLSAIRPNLLLTTRGKPAHGAADHVPSLLDLGRQVQDLLDVGGLFKREISPGLELFAHRAHPGQVRRQGHLPAARVAGPDLA